MTAVRRTVQPVHGSCRTSLVQAALYGTCAAHPIGDVTGAEGMHRSLPPHERNNAARRPCAGGGGTRHGLTWLPSGCVGSVLARQLGLGHHTASHSPFSRLAGFVALVAAPTGARWCPTASCRQGAGEGGQGRVAGWGPSATAAESDAFCVSQVAAVAQRGRCSAPHLWLLCLHLSFLEVGSWL